MKKSPVNKLISFYQINSMLIPGLLGCCLMLSGCGKATQSFAWLKKAPETIAQNIPKPSPKIKNPANLHVKYANWQEQMGHLSEAQDSYEEALSENPKSVDAILGLARLDHLAGRELAAEHGFKKALRLKPNDPHTMDTIGQFYVSQKKWPQAIEMLTAAMSANPNEKSYQYHLGIALARSGDINGALPHLEKTVGKAAAHYNIGYVLMEENQYPLASEHLRQSIILNPELVAAQTMLETVNKKLQIQQPGLNTQSPVLASQPSSSQSIQKVSGNQYPNQWETVNTQQHDQTIVPQGYQKPQTQNQSHWTPAVYTQDYQQQNKTQSYSNSVQGNKSLNINPGSTSGNHGTTESSQFQVPAVNEVPEQYPGY